MVLQTKHNILIINIIIIIFTIILFIIVKRWEFNTKIFRFSFLSFLFPIFFFASSSIYCILYYTWTFYSWFVMDIRLPNDVNSISLEHLSHVIYFVLFLFKNIKEQDIRHKFSIETKHQNNKKRKTKRLRNDTMWQ